MQQGWNNERCQNQQTERGGRHDEDQVSQRFCDGLAHGFVVLSDTVDFVYKCTDYYHPEDEKGLLWNDPAIGIEWQIDQPQLSEKDRKNKTLAELQASNELPLYKGDV